MGAKNGKSSGSGGTTSGPPARDRFKSTAQNRQMARNLGKIADGTAVSDGRGGYVTDGRGNIVGYSGGASKARRDREKRAAQKAAQSTIANPNLRPGTRTVSPSQFKARAEQELATQRAQRDALRDAARARDISSQQLAALARSNQRFGLNPTTGMGFGQSLRFQGQQLAQDLPGLARAAGFIANPLGSLATGLVTGGKGIASLAGDILGGLKTKGQNVLSELRDEDIVGYTDEGTPVRVGQSITETTDRPGFLSGIASALRFGEGAPFQERQFGGNQRGLAALIPPVQPTLTVMPRDPFDPQRIKKAVTPVGTGVTNEAMNEYLRLAGFNI
jgi:hypothetical protein